MQSRSTTRRRTLAAAAALAATPTAAIAAVADPDAELRRLVAEYRRLSEEHLRLRDELDKRQAAAKREYPEPPKVIMQRLIGSGDQPDRYRRMTIDEVNRFYDIQRELFGSRAPDRRQERIGAIKAYDDICRAIDARLGVPDLEDRDVRLDDAISDLLDRIAMEPARTPAGVLLKLEQVDFDLELVELWAADLMRSVKADLRAMAGRTA